MLTSLTVTEHRSIHKCCFRVWQGWTSEGPVSHGAVHAARKVCSERLFFATDVENICLELGMRRRQMTLREKNPVIHFPTPGS